MNNSEFILSKLEAAIASVKAIDLGAVVISAILGLLTVFLALATILPPSILVFIRYLLLIATTATVLVSYWVLRRLVRNRKTRLEILRKWEEETFFARAQLDLLEQEKVRKVLDLIQSIEDTKISNTTRYEQLDIEFTSILK